MSVYDKVMLACSNNNNSHKHAGEEFALSRRKVFSWRQKDEYGSDSNTGKVFHEDKLTSAELWRQ